VLRRIFGPKIFVESPSRLGRLRRRWEDGIKMDLRQTDLGVGVDSRIHRAQDRNRWRPLVNTVMNLRVLANGVSWLVS
jgi:hypothetical protein